MLHSALLGKIMQERDPASGLDQLKSLLVSKGHDGFNSVNARFTKMCEELDRTYGVDFNPTSSVLGSILSQEIIKVITERDSPAHGMMLYGADEQQFILEKQFE